MLHKRAKLRSTPSKELNQLGSPTSAVPQRHTAGAHPIEAERLRVTPTGHVWQMTTGWSSPEHEPGKFALPTELPGDEGQTGLPSTYVSDMGLKGLVNRKRNHVNVFGFLLIPLTV